MVSYLKFFLFVFLSSFFLVQVSRDLHALPRAPLYSPISQEKKSQDPNQIKTW